MTGFMRTGMWLTAMAMGLASWSCASDVEEAAPVLRPVRYEVVKKRPISIERRLAGVVRAGVESRLSFRVSGSLEQLSVNVGDRVPRGRTLARLDPTDYELKVEEAKAALAQGQANLRQAEADFERVRALYENSNASKADLDASRAKAESAVAQVDAVAKQLEQARRQLTFTSLRAPADGAVASVAAEVNENIQAGQEICLLISGGRPEVVISVPELLIGSIEAGQRVIVTIDALPGETFTAELTEVGVAVTGTATTYPVTARLLDENANIRAGMAAETTFALGRASAEDRMVVPGVAVGEDQQGRFVFVLTEADAGVGSIARRGVVIGAAVAEGIEILEGLVDGERVVTAGVRRLTDGMQVRVLRQEDAG